MRSNDSYTCFITCPRGLNYVLEQEIKSFGVERTRSVPSGVSVELDKTQLYRCLLWSRTANRVIIELGSVKADTADEIYDAAFGIDWAAHFDCDTSFAVDFLGENEHINNTAFGALRVKDAIVDKFRDQFAERPSVNKGEPDIRISARIAKGRIVLGLDLSGDSLHRRGYRTNTGAAPLKENLAAGLLMLAGWPAKFDKEAGFIDPMCGSGTLLIEAAMLACNKAPGLMRKKWGFSAWKQHDNRLWAALYQGACDAFDIGLQSYRGKIVGYDQDARVISKAWDNLKSAGFDKIAHVEKMPLEAFVVPEKLNPGLLLSNPPYGERLGEINQLKQLYALLGEIFERYLLGWQAAVFTGNLSLGKAVSWRSHKQYKLFNGAIDSQLLLFDLKQANRFKEASGDSRIEQASYNWKITNPERAKMFANRLLKNSKNIGKWAKKQGVSCYRLYDADMPEFSLAVDIYRSIDGEDWLHVQEYQAPKSVDEKAARERLSEGLKVLSEFSLNGAPVPVNRIAVKVRSIKKGSTQYEKESAQQDFFTVSEFDAHLRVNLKDYLDTGLFLDHRPIRKWVGAQAKGKRFLNLFCYTGAVTVSAAIGGAASTTSVDMSKTYLAWLKQNLELNKLNSVSHKIVQSDCMSWLNDAAKDERFDLIFLDPPSFSNSKRMQGVLDIQRDHAELIDKSMKLLSEDGVLVFSNNLRKFKLDAELTERYSVKDYTQQSLDKDYERNKHIHQCWMISPK